MDEDGVDRYLDVSEEEFGSMLDQSSEMDLGNDGDDISNSLGNTTDTPTQATEQYDSRSIDVDERRKVESFLESSCMCVVNDGRPCSSRYSYDHISAIRDQCSSMNKDELNSVLLGHVMATIRTTDTTIKVRHTGTERKRNTTTFMHEGEKVMSYIQVC